MQDKCKANIQAMRSVGRNQGFAAGWDPEIFGRYYRINSIYIFHIHFGASNLFFCKLFTTALITSLMI